ncbi:MAG: hemerythrin domain-containing protein [bacterium]
MPNAISIIKRDHRAVEKDYKTYKRAKDKDQKRRIAERIFDALDAHAKMEEEVFYPAVTEAGGPELQKMIVEALEEHGEMKHLVARFRAPNAEERAGMGMRIDELLAGVMHHVKEEEKSLLPKSARALGKARITALGERMEPMSPSAKLPKP